MAFTGGERGEELNSVVPRVGLEFNDSDEIQGTLDQIIVHFDTSFFSSSGTEVERLDPQQRQLLQVAFECMEEAGATSWRGTNIGCYVGVFGGDWQDLNAKETLHRGGYRATSNEDFVLGNRVSYEFDLHGPSMTVKTGCSSSLVGLDMACQAIRNGDCDGALVCGASLIFSPAMMLALSDQGVLSPSGTCKTFDASADGYGRGEAVNAIYVKKLSQALRDGDTVRAVIRGTGVNCDGRTHGMLTPSPTAQEALIRHVYEQAGISDLSETAVVECHGTGTAVGDRIETAAVAKCFGKDGVTITSVKPNVGHSEGAAGLTSLIKAILAIEHRLVPPNILFKTPNPTKCKLHVPVDTEAWPNDRAERVSVNSFGIGGVNAHVVVESLHQYGMCNRTPDGASGCNGNGSDIHNSPNTIDGDVTVKQHHALLFSAYSQASLEAYIEAYRQYLLGSRASLEDVAFTLANRRDHKSHRAYAVLGHASATLVTSVPEAVKPSPRVGWIFTGQGAQWPQMGVGLLDCNAVFQRTIKKLDKHLRQISEPPSWTIEEELRKAVGGSCVHMAELGHPLSIAVQIGLIDILKSWNVKLDFVVGHSSGEMAAAYASGAITAEAAIVAATFRGYSSGKASERRGSMAAIGLGTLEVRQYMEPGVVVACENSQSSVTVSGDADLVEKVVRNVKEKRPGVLARLLRVEKAFHSHHMLEYGPLYEEHLLPVVRALSPAIPFYSSVTGGRLTGDGCLGPAYWRQNMENPVLFNTALRAALGDQDGRVVIIEVGPHPALKGPVGQILRDLDRMEDVHVATLLRDKDCEESLLHSAGKLYQQNVAMYITAICTGGRQVANLPRYSWTHENVYWAEPRVARDWRFRKFAHHELLGSRVAEVASEPCWRNKLALEDVRWLSGHVFNGQVVFPGAGYICMVGEAIRQLDGGERNFSLSNVTMTAGLVLTYGTVAELVTSLTPTTAESTDEATCHSFSISSFDGTRWVRHCAGEARLLRDESVTLALDAPEPSIQLPRKVDESDWYVVFNRVGFNYTGLFRGLRKISAATEDMRAVATISTQKTAKAKGYAIHPAIIDQCFHLFTVAAYRGLGRDYGNIAVPTFIEEITIVPTTGDDLRAIATVNRLERGSFAGDLTTHTTGGQTAVRLKGLRTTALASSDAAGEDARLVTRLEWRPHVDFVQLDDTMRPRTGSPEEWALLEELMLLYIIDHRESIKPSGEAPPHLLKFLTWAQDHIDQYRTGSNPFVAKELRLWAWDSEQRLKRIEELAARVSASEFAPFSEAIYRLFKAADSIFNGETNPLHVLLEDGVLTQFYNVVDVLDYSQLIRAVAHTNPRMRILEVGAGTGGTTAKVLQALRSPYEERLYGSYTYTDISSGFMPAAKERFAGAPNMQYAVLDISQDPVQQGFELGNYDLIIGTNVVHATPSLQVTLGHLRSLLNPAGRLFLQELCPDAKFINYVMGFLPGWWLGMQDGRASEPYVSPDRWAKELIAAGFKEPDAIHLDGIAPYHSSAGIIAAPALSDNKPSRVTVMCYKPQGPYVQETKKSLERLGIAADICVFGEALISQQDLISVLDLEEPMVHQFSKKTFNTLIGYLQALEGRMIWATPSSQVGCQDPRSTMILGLARTARSELSAKLFTVEIDDRTLTSTATDLLARLLVRARSSQSYSESMDPDWEYAIVDGKVLVPRLHWQTMLDAFANGCSDEEHSWKQLTLKTPGLLNTMLWSDKKPQHPGSGEVLVRTEAIGLNFRDVLISLGVLEHSTRGIGTEACGVIAGIGPGVHDYSIGDRVIHLSSGCFASHIVLPQNSCVRIDDSITPEQGAALPSVYATAMMALVDRVGLKQGQTILIHSACGGVGLAAIQIAQMIGAEIYCTVGSEDKVQYLVENHNIPGSHIFSSRDASFLGDVMSATGNRGISFARSWKCVADFGTILEIGKRDFRRRSKLSMELFEANRTFVGFDLWQIFHTHPEQAAEALQRCVSWIRSGLFRPIVIAETFEAGEVQDAFKFMKPGRHIGKIIIRMPYDHSAIQSTRIKPAPVLRPDRSYLLIGGLGGLGRAVSTWMVEQGARHLIFLSRSAKAGPGLRDFLEELASQGCESQLVAGSVCNVKDVERAVQTAARPIAGVINLAMVLKDVSLSQMSFADWTTAVLPKVQGTWNLHNALPSDLDFFILCSSYSGIVGQWGEANYAAANTFLDAFVQYRRGNNLAACVIDIGVMGEVGFVSKHQDTLDIFQKSGMHILKEWDLLDALNLAIRRSKPQRMEALGDSCFIDPGQIILGFLTTLPISSPYNHVVWKRDPRASVYHNVEDSAEAFEEASSEENSIETLLRSAATRPVVLEEEGTTSIIARAITLAMATFLIKEKDSIKVEYSPDAVGVDSLVAMELRNWVNQKFGVEANAMTIIRSQSFLSLGDYIRLALIERFRSGTKSLFSPVKCLLKDAPNKTYNCPQQRTGRVFTETRLFAGIDGCSGDFVALDG
ncbi:polyketide synthase [Colletotrichum phormii]|uniref:Polyketide synthase n=1 Tax=Colletotrichum phormii TaxID=359342 RepID=A0AAI9ZCB9_9PEZI|nr:polyketide synthase [Colletotrichum phormii]KAK1621893.1 polyketide synthase [Colletotrichum phormii]